MDTVASSVRNRGKQAMTNLRHLWTETMLEVAQAVADAGGELRIAGGAVRDALANVKPKDIDFACTLRPGELMAAVQHARGGPMKWRFTDNSLKHGTITVRHGDEDFEITTLRVDRATDGRNAEVEFTTEWREDALRRDFF